MSDNTPPRPRIALLATCLVDLFRPSIGFAAVKLLEDAGCIVEVPEQTFCGHLALNSGDDADARVILRDVMRDRGEIAGYVPSSAYLCVVRDPSVAAELDAKLPGAWLTELKPHHKISPNLVTGDDDVL